MREQGFNKDNINFPAHMAYIYERTGNVQKKIKKKEKINFYL